MPTREEKDEFSILILRRAKELRTDHIDAIVTYCEEIGLEMEIAATLINEDLKAEIEMEAEERRVIPKSGRLPL